VRFRAYTTAERIERIWGDRRFLRRSGISDRSDGRQRRLMLQDGRRRAAQVIAAEGERTEILSWKDDSCDAQFDMRERRRENRECRVSTRHLRRRGRAHRACHHEAGVPLPYGSIYSYNFRV
jgi:hypothetical protein